MPLLAADPVTVLPEQREALEGLIRTHSTPQQIALRARVVVQAADGVACVPAHGSSASGPRRCGIGASAGGRRQTSGRSPSGWPMRSAQERQRRSRPSRSALWSR